MRIQNVEPIELAAPSGERSSPWSSTVIFVRVTTTSGAVGWGEAPTTLMTRPVFESVREVARFFEGRDLEESGQAFREFDRYSFYRSRSMEATSALSAVDIACFDLRAREIGAPISTLLGERRRDEVRAYANGWYSDCLEPAEFVVKAREKVREGFTALKFDPFGDEFLDLSDEGLRAATARVQSVREAVGPTVDLLIEFHGRFLPQSAMRAGLALDATQPMFMEEPVRPELCDALGEFRRRVRTPVALGERLLTPADFLSFLRRGLVDVLQPDITNSGGFTSAREIVDLASSLHAPLAYHNAFGPIQTAATLQVDSVSPTFLIQESFESSWPDWKRALVSGYSVERGKFRIPKGAGLGVAVNETAVERYRSEEMEPVGPEPPWVIAGTWVRRSGSSAGSAGRKSKPVRRVSR